MEEKVESAKNCSVKRKNSKRNRLRNLRLSLKYRPDILKLVLKMRLTIRKKATVINKMKQSLKIMKNSTKHINLKQIETESPSIEKVTSSKMSLKDSSTQTENNLPTEFSNSMSKSNVKVTDGTDVSTKESKDKSITNQSNDSAWCLSKDSAEGKSLADQVKEVAQSALQQTGMVYVESAGMYYDYKTGYYYNSELGLYYHTDTNCYYYYSDEKKEFVFHSYPDRRAQASNASLIAHEKRKARKQKKASKMEEDIDSLTKNLSQEENEESKPKRKKTDKTKVIKDKTCESQDKDSPKPKADKENSANESETKNVDNDKSMDVKDLEDGECSDTASEVSVSDDESNASTSTASYDDCVAKHHPPCMRIVVRETKLPKLKVGALFLVTKDGGTVGREGEHHTILLKEYNVSRNHLEIKYDMDRRMYFATDLGSKNGTLLNGIQMSPSQQVSKPMEVVHGSTLQLGMTKLLCHIHAGMDTCGHCEPGLIIETKEKEEKVAYTRTCSVQKQHQLELARLKNKYAPEPLMIEDGSYNDRAKARRDTVGSSHHSVKTESNDVDTFIAPENKGFKLLEKMGWSKGEGLGKENQGETEPIPLTSNEGKAGLGTPGSVGAPPMVPTPRVHNKLGSATLRLAARSKLLQPPAKAFQGLMDDEDDE